MTDGNKSIRMIELITHANVMSAMAAATPQLAAMPPGLLPIMVDYWM